MTATPITKGLDDPFAYLTKVIKEQHPIEQYGLSSMENNENVSASDASTNSVNKQSDSNLITTKEVTSETATGDLSMEAKETSVIEKVEEAAVPPTIPFHAKLHSKRDRDPAVRPRAKLEHSAYEKSVSLMEPITPAAVAQRILAAHGDVEDDVNTSLAPSAAAHRILRFRSVRNKPKSFSGWRESVRSVACGLSKDHESLDLLVKSCYLWKVRRKKFQVRSWRA